MANLRTLFYALGISLIGWSNGALAYCDSNDFEYFNGDSVPTLDLKSGIPSVIRVGEESFEIARDPISQKIVGIRDGSGVQKNIDFSPLTPVQLSTIVGLSRVGKKNGTDVLWCPGSVDGGFVLESLTMREVIDPVTITRERAPQVEFWMSALPKEFSSEGGGGSNINSPVSDSEKLSKCTAKRDSCIAAANSSILGAVCAAAGAEINVKRAKWAVVGLAVAACLSAAKQRKSSAITACHAEMATCMAN